MKFIVRKSIDYSVEIEAPSAEIAAKIAEKIPIDEWGANYSEIEVDEE